MKLWRFGRRRNFGALNRIVTNECRRKCDFGKSTGLDNGKVMDNKGKQKSEITSSCT